MNFYYDEWEQFVKYCGFTDIEQEIVVYLRRGWCEVDIAAELNVSPSTITRHKRKIKNKILRYIGKPI